jgi:hypothetical protein
MLQALSDPTHPCADPKTQIEWYLISKVKLKDHADYELHDKTWFRSRWGGPLGKGKQVGQFTSVESPTLDTSGNQSCSTIDGSWEPSTHTQRWLIDEEMQTKACIAVCENNELNLGHRSCMVRHAVKRHTTHQDPPNLHPTARSDSFTDYSWSP